MLYIASDHGGHALKKRLVRFVKNELKKAIRDLGPRAYDERDDYPDYAIPLARRVAKEKTAAGILICRNGIGVCIAANKIAGVRAGLGYSIAGAESMKRDDDTNVLCLPADYLSADHAMAILKRWLATDFTGAERHVRRLSKVAALEKRKSNRRPR